MDGRHSADPALFRRSPDDFSVEWFHGTVKAGGQHRNKHACSCRVKHEPTGIIESRQGRDRMKNLDDAMAAILVTLDARAAGEVHHSQAADRRGQVGAGMRGDKTVTIRFQDDQATHHGTGKTMRASKYMRGFMDELWS
jgi:peptide chain release factor 1